MVGLCVIAGEGRVTFSKSTDGQTWSAICTGDGCGFALTGWGDPLAGRCCPPGEEDKVNIDDDRTRAAPL